MTAKKKSNGLKPYKSYPFKGQDPIAGKVLDVIDQSGVKASVVSRESGVASSTVGNWRKRKTKRPLFATVNAVLMALDRELTITKRR